MAGDSSRGTAAAAVAANVQPINGILKVFTCLDWHIPAAMYKVLFIS